MVSSANLMMLETCTEFAGVGEEGIEERTQHTALWYTGAKNEGGRAVVV